MSIVVDIDFNKINQTIFEQMHSVREGSSEVKNGFLTNSLTETQLKNVEDSFSKDLTSSQTKRAMHFLRAFCEETTSRETDNTFVCLNLGDCPLIV